MREEGFTLYAVVMAGGRGKRLWPLSTPERPKQFIKFGGRSLLKRTYQRITPLVPPDRTLVITGSNQKQLVAEELPDLPGNHIIEEPYRRNTAPCIGLAGGLSETLLALDPTNSIMVVLPADHLVTRPEEFRNVVSLAAEVTYRERQLVTLGIEPTRPATGYGYIEAGEKLPNYEQARQVKNFTEKPDQNRARDFLDRGNYYWNSGTFIWRTDTLLNGLKRHLPQLRQAVDKIKQPNSTGLSFSALNRQYRSLDSVSIDYGLLEESADRAVIPSSIGWSDVGDWSSLSSLLNEDASQNLTSGDVRFVDSEDNVCYNSRSKPMVCFGVENLVIVDGPNGLLVMDKRRAEQLKPIVDKVEGGKNEDR